MNKCKKCGSDKINVSYVKKGSSVSGVKKKTDDEFLYSSEWTYGFDHYAEKEHLLKHCKSCQFNWRENTLDNQND